MLRSPGCTRFTEPGRGWRRRETGGRRCSGSRTGTRSPPTRRVSASLPFQHLSLSFHCLSPCFLCLSSRDALRPGRHPEGGPRGASGPGGRRGGGRRRPDDRPRRGPGCAPREGRFTGAEDGCEDGCDPGQTCVTIIPNCRVKLSEGARRKASPCLVAT